MDFLPHMSVDTLLRAWFTYRITKGMHNYSTMIILFRASLHKRSIKDFGSGETYHFKTIIAYPRLQPNFVSVIIISTRATVVKDIYSYIKNCMRSGFRE